MRARHLMIITLGLVLVSTTALARPRGQQVRPQRNTTNASTQRQGHGDRAYTDALRFAQQHNLKHFTVNRRGVRRIVVNVPSNKITDWCNTFSKGKCYVEPFFNASKRSAPGWSMFRVGSKNWRRYGSGDTYYNSTSGGRVAFPISLSEREMSSTMDTIKTSRNLPFKYNGGIWSGTGQNCTDWLTSKIGQFTGVSTASVKHHMSALVQGHHSNRSTVMAVMTSQPMQNFGQDQLNLQWH